MFDFVCLHFWFVRCWHRYWILMFGRCPLAKIIWSSSCGRNHWAKTTWLSPSMVFLGSSGDVSGCPFLRILTPWREPGPKHLKHKSTYKRIQKTIYQHTQKYNNYLDISILSYFGVSLWDDLSPWCHFCPANDINLMLMKTNLTQGPVSVDSLPMDAWLVRVAL